MSDERWSAKGTVRCPNCQSDETFVFMDAWAVCENCDSEWFTDTDQNYSDDDLSDSEADPILPNGLTREQWDDLSQMRDILHGGGEQGEPV